MNRIYISLRDIPTTRLQLGFEGENDHTQVIFDGTLLYARYPSAVASMTVKSPSGGLYPKTLVQSGNKLIWNITASDCAKFGSGQYQLTFTSGTEVIKTYIGNFSVNASLLGSGDPPDPVDDWLQEAQEALDAFEQDVSDAEAWAVGTRDGEPVGSTDPAYHNNSKYYAERSESVEQTIETTGAAQVAAIEAKGEEVLESIPSDYTALSEDVDELHAVKAPVITESASGSIASFPDGADGMPLRSLSVAIEPVQDLHGLDSPYPAGGGKNLIPSLNPLPSSGTVLREFDTPLDTAKVVISFRFTGSFSNGGASVVVGRDADNNDGFLSAMGWFKKASDNTTLTVDTTYTNELVYFVASVSRPIKKIVYTGYAGFSSGSTVVDAMIEVGSTRTTFAPYSNICPISGFSGAKVTRTGKNLFCDTLVNGQVGSTGGFVSTANRITNAYDGSPVLANTFLIAGTYTLSISGLDYCSVISKDESGNIIDNYANSWSSLPFTFTLTKPGFVLFTARKSDNADINPANFRSQISVGSGSSAYEPYQGETYDITFPSEAGTVYGGTLTIHQDGSGELVVDRAIFTEDGSSSIKVSNNNRFYINRNDARVIDASNQTTDVSVICDRLKSTAWAGLAMFDVSCSPVYGEGVAFRNDEITTIQGWKDYFTQNPTQFSYALATPVTYQLTNQQVIETLKGNNVLWADTGDVSVEYQADTKLYIDSKVAELQALILENISNS